MQHDEEDMNGLGNMLARLRRTETRGSQSREARSFAPPETRARLPREQEEGFPRHIDSNGYDWDRQEHEQGWPGPCPPLQPTAEQLADREPENDRLRRLEQMLARKSKLDEIADVARELTYGEMLQLAWEMNNGKKAPPGFDASKVDSDTLSFAAKLHTWATAKPSAEMPDPASAPPTLTPEQPAQ